MPPQALPCLWRITPQFVRCRFFDAPVRGLSVVLSLRGDAVTSLVHEQ
jgi:hypothetical protein